MGTHKGHEFGNQKRRTERERNLRRVARRDLTQLTKSYNKVSPKPPTDKRVTQATAGCSLRKKRRSGGTRPGATLRPHELWG